MFYLSRVKRPSTKLRNLKRLINHLKYKLFLILKAAKLKAICLPGVDIPPEALKPHFSISGSQKKTKLTYSETTICDFFPRPQPSLNTIPTL